MKRIARAAVGRGLSVELLLLVASVARAQDEAPDTVEADESPAGLAQLLQDAETVRDRLVGFVRTIGIRASVVTAVTRTSDFGSAARAER